MKKLKHQTEDGIVSFEIQIKRNMLKNFFNKVLKSEDAGVFNAETLRKGFFVSNTPSYKRKEIENWNLSIQ